MKLLFFILIPFSLVGLFAGVFFFARSRPVSVTVAVEDSLSGRPLVAIPVEVVETTGGAQPDWVETDEHGRVRFDDLKPGMTTFRVSIPDYKDFFQTVTLVSGGNDEVDFLLETETARVTGGVLNPQNRMPVVGATVLIGGAVGETDEEGQFALDEVIIGNQNIRIRKPGFWELLTKVSLERGMVKDVGELFLKPEI